MSLHFDPTQIVTAWTAAIAAASLVNKFLLMPYAPKVARVISAIISIPSGHLANVIEDLETLWKDVANPPAAPPPANGGEPPAPPAPPPAAPSSLLVGLSLAGALGLSGCQLLSSPPVIGGAEKVAECIIAHSSSWQELLADCSMYTLEEINAVIQTLLTDPSFKANRPDMIEPLKSRLIDVRAKLARQAADKKSEGWSQ